MKKIFIVMAVLLFLGCPFKHYPPQDAIVRLNTGNDKLVTVVIKKGLFDSYNENREWMTKDEFKKRRMKELVDEFMAEGEKL
jgi:hypothetical protein